MPNPTGAVTIMSMPDVRELLADPAMTRTDIEARLRELERSETAAIDEIDALRERLLVDAPDEVIDSIDRKLAAATRRLERIEARECALYERLNSELLGGDAG